MHRFDNFILETVLRRKRAQMLPKVKGGVKNFRGGNSGGTERTGSAVRQGGSVLLSYTNTISTRNISGFCMREVTKVTIK